VGLLEPYLDDIALAPTDAVDTNTFVVTQETADELGITTISDLKDVVG
jgi:glycine betaine/choline ABC-type transport system substrate-binding protein